MARTASAAKGKRLNIRIKSVKTVAYRKQRETQVIDAQGIKKWAQ